MQLLLDPRKLMGSLLAAALSILVATAACTTSPPTSTPLFTAAPELTISTPLETLVIPYPQPCSAMPPVYPYPPVAPSTPLTGPIPQPYTAAPLLASPSPSPFPTKPGPTPTLPPSLSSLRIAYTRGKQLWIWLNNASTPLTGVNPSSQVRISDDGKFIAFTRDGGLWAINDIGSKECRLVSPDDFKAMEPTDPGVGLHQFDWIPNSHILMFNTILHQSYGLALTDDLHTADAEACTWKTLLPHGEGGLFFPALNGEQVAIVSPTHISLARIDGTDHRVVLEYPAVSTYSEFFYYPQPVWVTDSGSLLVAIPPADPESIPTPPTTIWRLSADDAAPTVMAKIDVGSYEGEISPDLSLFAYSRLTSQETGSPIEIHITSIDGSIDEIYRRGRTSFMGWAPDSQHFVFWLDRESHLYLGQAGSQDALPLTYSLTIGITWIDSTHFLFNSGNFQREELSIGVVGQPSILLVGPEEELISYDFTK